MLNGSFEYNGVSFIGLRTGDELGIIGALQNQDVMYCAAGDVVMGYKYRHYAFREDQSVLINIWKQKGKCFHKVSTWSLSEQERLDLARKLANVARNSREGQFRGCIGWDNKYYEVKKDAIMHQFGCQVLGLNRQAAEA